MGLPKLSIVLTPQHVETDVKVVDVDYCIQGITLAKGEELGWLSIITASIPCCELKDNLVTAEDEDGWILLEEGTRQGDFGMVKCWNVQRETRGDIRIHYGALPRLLPEGYRSSPYFDLRTEENGISGAGIVFLLHPKDVTYELSVEWDMSGWPEVAEGIWSQGKTLTSTPKSLLFSYYVAGNLSSWTAPDNADFKVLWLAETSFDVAEIAETVYDLYKYQSVFFKETSPKYTVFMRKDPFEESGGGTAFENGAFIFGYSDAKIPTREKVLSLLAHEMVHNWPSLDEGTLAENTWYSEGTAEYYCMVLPYRAGISDGDYVIDCLNRFTDKYYGNVFREVSYEEALANSWTDRRNQVIPYGRGVFYLIKMNYEIRQATQGKHSLDDVVLGLLEMQRCGRKISYNDFINKVNELIGTDIRDEFMAIAAGQMIEPKAEWFNGAFTVTPKRMKAHRCEEEIDSYVWERREGVRDSDIVL